MRGFFISRPDGAAVSLTSYADDEWLASGDRVAVTSQIVVTGLCGGGKSTEQALT